MTGHRRPLAALALLGLAAGPMPAGSADWASGSYSPGASAQPADAFGRQQHYGGTYRPIDSPSAHWQAPAGSGAGSTGSPSTWDPRGAAVWNGEAQGLWTEPRPGASDRPLAEYRFRQRTEDKAQKTDDSPRFRPDPELTRRSQQSWGVPGQDPSHYGAGPRAVFRPLRPEQEQTSRPATTGQYSAPAQPPWSGYPAAPPSGYGYPY